MLSFLKPAARQPQPNAASEKHDDAPANPAVESTPVQDAQAHNESGPHAQLPDQSEVRVSAASIPTIDSAPTIQDTSAEPHSAQTPSQPPPSDSSKHAASLAPPSPLNAQGSAPSVHTQSSAQSDRPMDSQSQSALPYSSPSPTSTGKDPRRFSFPSLSFLRPDTKQNKPSNVSPSLQVPVSKAPGRMSRASRAISVLIVGNAASSEKRAKESADIVRSVIIGDHNIPPELKSKMKPVSKDDLARVKSHLLDPKSAANVITHLRALPAHPDDATTKTNLPIHAVCLSMPDKDIHEQFLSRIASVATASVSTISTALVGLHLIDLVTAPNLGFGAPVTAQGLFAGAVPTAETVLEGIEQITPQLMALGYATGKSILPDHKGVIAPTDRISALTYWWGFEICLPPPTIALLERVESPGTTLLNLLTALSVLNAGVRELLPFIRYIAQFVQTEWSLIKRADGGKGVVCTATWLLPVALVPRPWDFSDPPPPHTEVAAAGQSAPTSPLAQRFSTTLATPKHSVDVPSGVPRSSSAYSSDIKDGDEPRPVISKEPPVLPEVVVSSPGSIDGASPESVSGDVHNAQGKAHHGGEPIAH